MTDPKAPAAPPVGEKTNEDGVLSRTLSAELLHRHVDRDLDRDGLEALARAAALDPMVRRRLEGLLEVRAIVQEAVAAQTPAIDSEALYASIEAALDRPRAAENDAAASAAPEAPAAPARPALRALPGGKQAPAEGGASAARVRRIGAATIGVLAIAAVAFLALRGGEEPATVAGLSGAPGAGGTGAARRPSGPLATEVLEVDFGTNIGTIFSVEGDEGDRYAVVWLDEAEEPTRGPRPERPASGAEVGPGTEGTPR